MPDDELQLVERAVGGDARALDAVLRLWGPRVHRFARRLCPVGEALDAVQDTLVVVAARIGSLRAAEAITSWTFEIVRRKCLRAYSFLSRETSLVRHFGVHGQERAPDRTALLEELRRVTETLPLRDRQVVLLKDLEGLSLSAIALRLDLSLPAVKSRLHRARTLLRERMLASPLARTLLEW